MTYAITKIAKLNLNFSYLVLAKKSVLEEKYHEIKEALQETQSKKILVSPIIQKKPVSGPAGKMLQAKDYDVSVTGLTKYYKDFITDIVIDKADIGEKKEIENMEKVPHVTNILMRNKEEEAELARELMKI